MFGLRIVAVGKPRRAPADSLTETYLDRAAAAARGLGIDGPSLVTVEAPRGLKGPARQAREAELLMATVGAREVVLLDERGKDLASRALADLVAARRDLQGPGLDFLIGGADGFAEGFRAGFGGRAVATIAFGKATWPHALVRAMLAEQLYRATTLLSGHPYHRD